MSVARIKDVSDGVAAFLAAAWLPAPLAAPDTVESVWVDRFTLNPNDPDRLLTGRRVAVMPVVPGLEVLARGYWKNKYAVAVMLAERYTDPGVPTEAWVDERVRWWERSVFYPLCNPGLVITGPGGIVTAAQPDPATPPEVTDFIDRDMLTDLKLLFIVTNFAFVDATDHTGAD